MQRPDSEEVTAGPSAPKRGAGASCNKSQAEIWGSFQGVPGLDRGGKLAVTGEAREQRLRGGWLTPQISRAQDFHREHGRDVGEPCPFFH